MLIPKLYLNMNLCVFQLQNLTIYEPNSTATHDDVSALCDLMTFSVGKLYITNWEIDREGIQRLEDTLQLRDSKV